MGHVLDSRTLQAGGRGQAMLLPDDQVATSVQTGWSPRDIPPLVGCQVQLPYRIQPGVPAPCLSGLGPPGPLMQYGMLRQQTHRHL